MKTIPITGDDTVTAQRPNMFDALMDRHDEMVLEIRDLSRTCAELKDQYQREERIALDLIREGTAMKDRILALEADKKRLDEDKTAAHRMLSDLRTSSSKVSKERWDITDKLTKLHQAAVAIFDKTSARGPLSHLRESLKIALDASEKYVDDIPF